MKALRCALVALAACAVQASAQIPFIHPFARQGIASVQALTTASSTTFNYMTPPLTSNGLAVSPFSFIGYKFSNASGMNWNTVVQPYALKFDFVNGAERSEIHDTTYDRGQSDPSVKRRAEIHAKIGLKNGVNYCEAYSFLEQPLQRQMQQGYAEAQMHNGGGGSPAFAPRRYPNDTFGFTINPGGNKKVGTAVFLARGAPHDLVMCFRLTPAVGADGALRAWVDGNKIVDYLGPLGGEPDGYYPTFGNYAAGGTNGNVVVTEYAHIQMPTTLDLSARITAAPAW